MIIEKTDGTKHKVTVNKNQIIIGRSESCDVPLKDQRISSQHARIIYDNDTFTITDLKSSNGVYVNQNKIRDKRKITSQDQIQIGPFRIVVLPIQKEKKEVAKGEENQDEDVPVGGKYDAFAYIMAFLNPVAEFLNDDKVTEIMINGPNQIYIESKGKLQLTDAHFRNEDALKAAVKNIGRAVGRVIDRKNPRMDARLQDGSRIHAIISPVSLKGTCMAIRKFSKKGLTMEDLIGFGAVSPDAVKFIDFCVKLKKNIVVSGGTGSGKTSLLNAISLMIPHSERIIVLEDSAELQLQQEHVLQLEAQMPDKKGLGKVEIRDLLNSTLRLRPDRIIVGEIRGGEAIDMLQAMNTGHGGSMTTIHSNSPRDTLSRLETTSLMSGIELPLRAIRDQIAAAIDVIIHTSRFHDGSRKLTHITEVLPLTPEGRYEVQNIFELHHYGFEKDGKLKAKMEPKDIIPTFYEDGITMGLKLPQKIFSSKN